MLAQGSYREIAWVRQSRREKLTGQMHTQDLEIPHLVGLLDTLAYLPKCKGDTQPFVKAFTSCWSFLDSFTVS